jgi:hypothetical protein
MSESYFVPAYRNNTSTAAPDDGESHVIVYVSPHKSIVPEGGVPEGGRAASSRRQAMKETLCRGINAVKP